MEIEWAATGAAAGLVAGTALRGAVFRLSVPSGTPDRTACPQCTAAVRRWSPIRCGRCGAGLSTPLTLELATAAVLALLLGRFGGQPQVLAFAVLGTLGVALAAIDLAVQRLPDRLVLPAYPLVLALLGVAAAVGHDGPALLRAVLGGVALTGAYLLLAHLCAGRLGGGDIKLAGLSGLALGWLGWPALVLGAALGFVLAGVASLALLTAGRITLRSSISFGPYLLGGALVAALAHG